ncbi:glycosyltransferase [Sphingomonas naphthae]|uniref:Glycosyltransferase n=1 Tax=Sphingomonas naphthae TaxID=1813468 RepID=A0ABY7TF77_9SPHN|nr:glycosyltransferase [Sphingomonas naphthae]WCT71897.1 glycosyltransferase [Sphingomonas naphthae]
MDIVTDPRRDPPLIPGPVLAGHRADDLTRRLPCVTVAVAAYNAAAFLEAAVRSALDQRGVHVEVVIVDDVSSDDTPAIAARLAAEDPRVRVERMAANGGPAGARNRAIELARGRWLAILDSDDLMHPDRLYDLLTEGETSGADLIADDLMLFDEAGVAPPTRFLDAARATAPGWIDLPAYLRETVMYGRRPNLGFLKPVIRMDRLRQHGLRYDESLRIAEDDDLIVRLLAAGARYRLLPRLGYFYRKHGTSISHRLSLRNAEAMVAAGEGLDRLLAGASPDARHALAARNRALRATRDFTRAIDLLKERRPLAAMSHCLSRPGLLPLFRMPIGAKLKRLLPRRQARLIPPDPKGVCFISRQRLTGATNGSSAYLLDLARSVRAAGLVPHLVQPSPTLFGRMPVMRMQPEMAVFASHSIRGAIRIGDRWVARDPAIWLAAARGIVARFARRFGLKGGWTEDRKAPYAVTTPWLPADRLFVAEQARPRAAVAIADYAFQSSAFPYLLRPGTPTAIVMHDLFHARSAGFAATGTADSVALVSKEEEIALLARADAVIAIQAEEARFVDRDVRDGAALLVPMAAEPVVAPQPGAARKLLFVGSNTAPNIHGLRWLFDEVWPAVRAAVPDATLDICGTVAWAFPEGGPAGTRFLGLVDDLAAAYAGAGVVVSPLRQGSGLKIKLIEALAHGKAVVATSVTLQGVEDVLAGSVAHADAPDTFAAAITALATDDAARTTLAARGWDAARAHFSAETAHRAWRDWLKAVSPAAS